MLKHQHFVRHFVRQQEVGPPAHPSLLLSPPAHSDFSFTPPPPSSSLAVNYGPINLSLSLLLT